MTRAASSPRTSLPTPSHAWPRLRRLGLLASVVALLLALVPGVASTRGPSPQPYAAPADAGLAEPAPVPSAPEVAPLADRRAADGRRLRALRLVGLNDLHGALEPPTGSTGRVRTGADEERVAAGGAAYLATHVAALRRAAPRSVLLSAGDNVGGSPPASALLHEEPTVAVLDAMGLAASVLGNHELDQGFAELRRLTRGGCHPEDGCRFAPRWDGVDFPVLGANVVHRSTGRPALPATTVVRVDGVRLGVIGVTLRDLPSVSTPAGVRGLAFGDEVAAANAASRALTARGVRAQVMLLHQGDQAPQDGAPDDCGTAPDGPARTIAEAVSPEVDVVLTGHTHQQYVCQVEDPTGRSRPVVQGLSAGRLLSVVDLQVDPRTGDVVRDAGPSAPRARNHVVTRDVAPDPEVARLVDRAVALVRPVTSRRVGSLAEDLPRAPGETGASPLGRVVADAQLAATRRHSAQVALVNLAGLRADLTPGADGAITWGDAYAALPSRDRLRTMTLRGSQLLDVLQRQLVAEGAAASAEVTPVLAASSGLTYSWGGRGAAARVADVRLDGVPVDPGADYRVTVNAFLAAGGEGFVELTAGRAVTAGPRDLDALLGLLAQQPGLTPRAAAGR